MVVGGLRSFDEALRARVGYSSLQNGAFSNTSRPKREVKTELKRIALPDP
jgi:hypothetical protein